MQKIKYTHGILYNDKDERIEAWNNGRLVDKISYECSEETKKIWQEALKEPSQEGIERNKHCKQLLDKLRA